MTSPVARTANRPARPAEIRRHLLWRVRVGSRIGASGAT
jgi:hypothetical protein